MGLDQVGFGGGRLCPKSSPQRRGPGQVEEADDGPAYGVQQYLHLEQKEEDLGDYWVVVDWELAVAAEEKREELELLGGVLQGQMVEQQREWQVEEEMHA